MTTHAIDAPAHREAKRLIGQAASHIKSSHRAEALARGLGFATNAALQDALSRGSVRASTDRPSFEAFLGERGYRIQDLQAALLTDAVILACGESLDRIKLPPGGYAGGRFWACMKCRDEFVSMGPNNLLCGDCHERNGRVVGVNHAHHVVPTHLGAMLRRGRLPSIEHLRVRPGWSDILDGAEFVALSRQAVRIKGLLDRGDTRRATRSDKEFVHTYADLDIRGDIPPPRGWQPA